MLLQGIAEFNRGEFFACHETLELLWKEERAPVRELYQGIIQIAAGLHHLTRGNHRGVVTLLERGLARLRPLPPECQGVAVGDFVPSIERALLTLIQLGPDRIGDFDERRIPTLRVKGHVDA
jgi:predicted metal-dependent hydrolase